jgi:hypothetical protein
VRDRDLLIREPWSTGLQSAFKYVQQSQKIKRGTHHIPRTPRIKVRVEVDDRNGSVYILDAAEKRERDSVVSSLNCTRVNMVSRYKAT